MYKVELDSFQGPLDLLYNMIKKNEIELNEISLAEVTDQYLQYTGYFQNFNLEVASEFMLIAGELIQLKARYLLPAKVVTVDEEEEESNLLKRLQEYELYKNISEILRDYKEKGDRYFFRPVEMTDLTEEEYRLEIDFPADELQDIFNSLLQQKSLKEETDSSIKQNYLTGEQFRVKDRIKQIRKQIKLKKTAKFFDFIKNRRNLLEVVVTLLSILELVKLGEVIVKQNKLFKEIKIEVLDKR